MPADGAPFVFALGDVERAIHEHRETQAGAGAELQHANAALDAIGEFNQADAGELRQHARMRGDITARARSTV